MRTVDNTMLMPNLGLYATTSVRVAALEFRDVAAVCRVASLVEVIMLPVNI